MFIIKSFKDEYEEYRKTTVASPILNIQSWELFNHVMIPIRNILIPAVIHTAPAVMSKICLLTPYFIRFTFLL